MRAKNTTQISKEHESFIEDLFAFASARRSKSSGAAWQDNTDVVSDTHVIECEATEKKSIGLKLSFWQEIIGKAYNGKTPALALRFRDPFSKSRVDLMVVDAEQYAMEQEELEVYRQEALNR